ncbi:hypothetical protein DICPUDRAFT_82536 [Dictyostelium purpureum]|uniref:Uncharacterized protein n=1 Tax=Dictyostelium purpureum TaxID=5786 RepID=F0ZWT8_DICPU|nr:uncharacterized protein DICPUDRAFT_82536 [Dictyostelium purpureum]EGC31598.1 hypothetical protein DICPUDRAFT_82536 [Dictyostelium purpureum]|eukprot:XP_003291882.1 hypothetical protein DICPUDRAFT_82536 [Dictyostelium purpureum]
MLLKLVLIICLILSLSFVHANVATEHKEPTVLKNLKFTATTDGASGRSDSGSGSGSWSGQPCATRDPKKNGKDNVDGVTFCDGENGHFHTSTGYSSGTGGNSGETSGSGNTGRYPDTTTVNDGVTYKANKVYGSSSTTTGTNNN